VSLNGRVVSVDGAQERVESDVADVLVAVEQETAQNIHGKDSQTGFRADMHYGENSFV